MSYLHRPRLHFSGKVVVRVATANNSATAYDGRAYFDVANVALDTGGDADAFREWLHQRNPEGYVNALWDYYGDNHIRFDQAIIHSTELENSDILTDPSQDGALGCEIQIGGHRYNGRQTSAYLVDTDPTDAFTTQLYSDTLTIKRGESVLLEANGATRSFARWLNYWRNLTVDGDEGSSAWWQIALPKAGLKWGDIESSSALQALRAGIEQREPAQGLVIRFCTYLFKHPSYREISRKFEAGERTAIEGMLLVAGTIGLWDQNEFASIPTARLLLPTLEGALEIPPVLQSQRKGNKFYLGAVLAKVDTARHIITLDLINTFPEVAEFSTLSADSNSQNAPEKFDGGTLFLGIQEHCAPETCQKLAELPFTMYQQSRYWQTSGILELPYPPEMEEFILHGDLILFGTPDKPLLQETPYTALTDHRSVYLDLEQKDFVTPNITPIQILLRGEPALAGLAFPLSQTVNQDRSPSSSSTSDEPTRPPANVLHTRFRKFQRAGRDTALVYIPSTVKTNLNGKIDLPIVPMAAGTGKIWFNFPDGALLDLAGGDQERYFLRGGLGDYLNIRVLPDDSRFDRVPDTELTWEFIHREVFSYYSLLYPAMNRFINFDSEEYMRAYAAGIKALISEKLRETTAYMPVTRELSAGKRRLIQRWADLQLKK